jgi:hypothetical protein
MEEGAVRTRLRQGCSVAGVSWLGRQETTTARRVRVGLGRIWVGEGDRTVATGGWQAAAVAGLPDGELAGWLVQMRQPASRGAWHSWSRRQHRPWAWHLASAGIASQVAGGLCHGRNRAGQGREERGRERENREKREGWIEHLKFSQIFMWRLKNI